MPNTLACGECTRYHQLERPQPGGRKSRNLHCGHCLDRTVYAVNKPGNHTYPAGAKTAKLPFGRHQLKLVQETEIVAGCIAATPRKET